MHFVKAEKDLPLDSRVNNFYRDDSKKRPSKSLKSEPMNYH